MKDKQSKKVVIINDINSETIERAILILKDAGSVAAASADCGIVAEAQNIINSYIRIVEKNQNGLARCEKRLRKAKSKPHLRTAYVIGALLAFFAAGYVICEIFNKIMVNI